MTTPAFIRSITGSANFQNFLDLSIDCGSGSDRALLIEACDVVVGASRYPLSATVGGVTMNVSAVSVDGINGLRYAAFNLTDVGGLPSGVQTIHITMASASAVGHPLAEASLYGTTTAVAAPVAGGAYNANVSKTVTTTAGQLVVSSNIVDPSGVVLTVSGSANPRVNVPDYYQLHSMDLAAAGASTTITATAPSAVVSFGHAWVLTGTGAGGDTTPPTLTSPTGASSGSTTATGSVSTNEASGTLYRLASTNATETAATVKAAALSQAVSATGVQTVAFTGLTASTTYYAHYVHTDAAGNDSTVANSASFTTGSGADATAPVLTGSITIGAVTSTSIQVSHPAGTDNVGVAGYEYSKDGGATYVASGTTATTYTFTGLTSGTSYSLRVRAKDASGNVSTPPLSATQSTSAAVTATITTDVVTDPFGITKALFLIEHVPVMSLAGAVVANLTNQTTNSAGRLVLTDAAFVAGTTYMVPSWNADGSVCGNKAFVAA